MPEKVELTSEEIGLLGKLLQGHKARSPLRAATRLVKRRLAEWGEPDGDLDLTPVGRAAAVKLWPNVIPADPSAAVAAERGTPQIASQISLLVETEAPSRGTPLGAALVAVLGGDAHAEALAEVVLAHYPQARGLAVAPRRSLQALGLSHGQARTVVQAFALARAAQQRGLTRVDSAEQMAAEIFASQHVASLEVECFWVAALDAGNKLVAITEVARGGLSRVDIQIRDLFVPLVRARAHAAYIAHNHPSGDARWSDSDLRLTQRVTAAGERLGIEIVDHLILAPSGAFVSMEQEGAL